MPLFEGGGNTLYQRDEVSNNFKYAYLLYKCDIPLVRVTGQFLGTLLITALLTEHGIPIVSHLVSEIYLPCNNIPLVVI